MGPKSRNEIIETLAFYGLKLKSDNGTVLKEQGNCIDRLNEMIGLNSVKDQIRHMAAYVKMKKDMEEKGLNKLSTSFNMAFLGNPGTAKTTVARIVAGIFQEIGLIKHTKIIETGRSDLVGEYVGHTAVKVQEVFKKAKGGILFIDEAYSLVDDYMNSFGDEAISTLVQEMENNRNEVIVIFAGYPEKMKEFISRNPGLKSRIPFSIYFEDYTAEEMCQIAILEAKKRGFSINPGALDKVKNICETAVGKSEAGNGRFCRNIVESAILEYALREYEKDENADEKTFELLECDFVNTSYEDTVSEKNKIGF